MVGQTEEARARRFTAAIAELDDGIASLTDPARHVYCPLFWSDDGVSATHIRYPGPCGKCGRPDTEHNIDELSRRRYAKWPHR